MSRHAPFSDAGALEAVNLGPLHLTCLLLFSRKDLLSFESFRKLR